MIFMRARPCVVRFAGGTPKSGHEPVEYWLRRSGVHVGARTPWRVTINAYLSWSVGFVCCACERSKPNAKTTTVRSFFMFWSLNSSFAIDSEIELEPGDRPNFVALFLNRVFGIASINPVWVVAKVQHVDEQSDVFVDPLTCGEVDLQTIVQPVVGRLRSSNRQHVASLIIKGASRRESFSLIRQGSVAHVGRLPGQDEIASRQLGVGVDVREIRISRESTQNARQKVQFPDKSELEAVEICLIAVHRLRGSVKICPDRFLDRRRVNVVAEVLVEESSRDNADVLK